MLECVRPLAAGVAALILTGSIGCTTVSAQPAPRSTAAATIEPLNLRPDFEYFGRLDLDPAIPAPASSLGHEIGDRFTRHADVVAYLRAVAAASDRVTMHDYGRTFEGRSLHYLVISSPENLRDLESIRTRNLALADPRGTSDAEARRIIENNPAVVWLSYNVHGNEASSSEAAMQVVYTMAAARNAEVRDILDKVVLVVDPMINPDGRDRYVNWYNMTMGAGLGANPSRDAAEHDEPWPGGRTNHYYFDLNRDWLWLSQVESAQRLPVYRSFLPQLHIDYHEQGYRSPYFFGAGDDPYNQNIPAQTREWINLYGSANAKVFDERGLVYSTRERFDYLYPGYGKVLPVYHGAVGLLCEQAGHGFAGLAVDVAGEYSLTLRRRAVNHFLTSMSYLETTAANRRGQLERFRRFFTESAEGPSDGPAAFVISPDNDPALLKKVWDLCSGHGIEVERLTREATIAGLTSYKGNAAAGETRVPAGAWIVRAAQPMGRLAKAVFEPDPIVTDNDTYDITSWSLPVAFGLDAWFTDAAINAATEPVRSFAPPAARVTGAGEVAVMVDARAHHFPVAVGLAMKHDLFARMAGGEITTPDGATFGPGSLIVHTVRNRPEQMRAFVNDCVAAGIGVHRVATGEASAGHVLGADDNSLYNLPKVLLVRGTPTQSNSAGSHWWLLDLEQPIPYTAVNADALGRADLSQYNVIVMPEGGPLGESVTNAIKAWVRNGGTLIASGSSTVWASRSVLELKPDETPADRNAPKPNSKTFAQRLQESIDGRVPGAMLLANVDTSHPMAASGVRDWIGFIKRGDRTLPVADAGYVVARFADARNGETLRLGGSISRDKEFALSGTPAVTHHNLGRGNVVCFAEDFTFRAFHHAGMRLLMNAIVFGPTY